MNTPLVSVVIPTYNRAPDLERALKSVIAQSFGNWEALVVDNHSADNSDDVIRGFRDERIKSFKIHNEGVIAASRNLGIERATGAYVAFLDSDDWWTPRKLERSVEALQSGADVVYHDLRLVTKAGQRIFVRRARSRTMDTPLFEDLLFRGNALINSSVVVRRECLLAIGGIAEDRELVGVEDYDAWLRLAKKTEKFTRIRGAFGYYWEGGGGISNPRRTIETLAALEARYELALRERPKPAWLSYARGRAYQRLGMTDEAKQSFRQVRWRRNSLGISVKSLIMRALVR